MQVLCQGNKGGKKTSREHESLHYIGVENQNVKVRLFAQEGFAWVKSRITKDIANPEELIVFSHSV